MSDIDWWVWVIVAVVLIAVLLGLAAASRQVATRRLVKQREQDDLDRGEAEKLRRDADATHAAVQRREAEAATAHADAEEARLQAQQLQREAADLDRDATRQRGALDDQLAEADRIDPDVTDGAHVKRDEQP
ncbi:hypothetical protein [Aeromicrobium sp. UC242_57]|uniref:hypothetical protein n=1 Tax=Aeromicrobium sp. UC242_57 TaxID=3374624 RepID=UPI0037B5F9AB